MTGVVLTTAASGIIVRLPQVAQIEGRAMRGGHGVGWFSSRTRRRPSRVSALTPRRAAALALRQLHNLDPDPVLLRRWAQALDRLERSTRSGSLARDHGQARDTPRPGRRGSGRTRALNWKPVSRFGR
jgi:hypothetical protein